MADIASATHLRIDSTTFDLAEETRFAVDGQKQSLRVVFQAWEHVDSSAADYISDCEAKGIPTLTFLHRTDLTTWLSGSADQSQFIEEPKEARKADAAEERAAKRARADPFLEEIVSNERDLIDHNSFLRGVKQIDFSYVARECEIKLVNVLKKKTAAPVKSVAAVTKNKNPIIIISPSPSALLTMANIKEFLENGDFVDPANLSSSGGNALLKVSRTSAKLGGTVNFLVVENVAQLTKPEYWDRVVGIFTTGQAWQFKQYPDGSNPHKLFRRIKGFYVGFSGDAVPKSVTDWNVELVEVDRNRRFRDRQVVEGFWDALEKGMLARGMGK
ncbi:hypothetical protein BABINDRAFT_37183 [Babjeviella inositovora NRRL Y-12698]|uniref:Cell division control protein 73 C-terminal domain-containing protein n=1 Tax=Babjeviella inositovora NRRL Y-12698 TaxID=984486 RepID=A0A1E3QNP9_9ASCO|nr:uncharacterized protein BABINDRAFT_37183 [Babjeviella inositovora NRRL Y-12698]ODQ79313.1 hypothetical protein BABINDRAFT_37183 [Babjeviella inositovora NRRL Y-12698]